MEWVRGENIGHGSFGTVSLAIPRTQTSQIPSLMAVKSCAVSHSASLMNERLVLDQLKDCSDIIRCFGDNMSFENGQKLYNVLLEYAAGGALADLIKNSGNLRLPESEVQRYTKSIVGGLHYIHKNGYVHCDIKPQNILLFSSQSGRNDVAKIADFGLVKKEGEASSSRCELRGTPLYMAPEMVSGGEIESPADIWALGCVVVEMVTGSPAWRCRTESDVAGLLMRIGVGEEVPEIPRKLSAEGKDFLGKCFVKNPRKRWTAEMLLNHPFAVANYDHDGGTKEVPSTSPKSPFEFPDWVSVQSMTCSITSLSSLQSNPWSDKGLGFWCRSSSNSPLNRLWQLVTDQKPDWSVSETWVTVR